ncbi:hypothetical protein [Halorussus pelagicus]|uniref:hypothetical protein n=1 Tax=Halorussus pelagicus TaxID=2505977 RepID=UPI000FFB411B|nr:hypothetical protein [Halorussus pelagicus]
MTLPTGSRRSFVASVAVALAGCAGTSKRGNESDSATTTTQTTDERTTTGSDAEGTTVESDDAAPTVAWDEVAPFRKWLTDYSTIPNSNHRFDYVRGYSDAYVKGGRVSFLDLSRESFDGHLTQSGNVIHLGSFDAASLTARIEESPDHERTGEYEKYAFAEQTETGIEVAVSDDALLAGSDLRTWIDTRLGKRERLEERDPDFTRVFQRLPDRGLVTGQYGPPTGGEIDNDAIKLWGLSRGSLSSDTATWVYVFETAEDLTDEALTSVENGLGPLVQEVTNSKRDGRFATITATPVQL